VHGSSFYPIAEFQNKIKMARPRRSILHVNYQKLAGLQEEHESIPPSAAREKTVRGNAQYNAHLTNPSSPMGSVSTNKEEDNARRTNQRRPGAVCCSVCGRSRQVGGRLAPEQRRQLAVVSRGRCCVEDDSAAEDAAVCSSCWTDVDAVSRKMADLEAKLEWRDLGKAGKIVREGKAGTKWTADIIADMDPDMH
jgi:hypothetical protein